MLRFSSQSLAASHPARAGNTHWPLRRLDCIAAQIVLAATTLGFVADVSALTRTRAVAHGTTIFGEYSAYDEYWFGLNTPAFAQGPSEVLAGGTPDGAFFLASRSGVHGTADNTYATAHADLVTGIAGVSALSAPASSRQTAPPHGTASRIFAMFDLQDSFTVRFQGGGTRILEARLAVHGDVTVFAGDSPFLQPSIVGTGVFKLGGAKIQYGFGYNYPGITTAPDTLQGIVYQGQTYSWLDYTMDVSNPLNIQFVGHVQVTDGQMLQFESYLDLECRDGAKCDYGGTVTPLIVLPAGVTLMSEATGNAVVFAAVATPVPEPHTYALMFAGLAAIGLAMRRKGTNG